MLCHIVSTATSFRSVASPFLRDYLHGYSEKAARNLPSEKHLRTQALDILYSVIMDDNRQWLQSSPMFSIVFDPWTSRGIRHGYVAVAYSIVTKDFKPESRLLDLVHLTRCHRGSYLALTLAHRISLHSTDQQVLYAANRDGASNVVNASKLLMQRLEALQESARGESDDFVVDLDVDDDDELVNDNDQSDVDKRRAIHGLAHRAQLAINDVYKANGPLRQVIEKIDGIVSATRRSEKVKMKLREICTTMGVPYRALAKRGETRWGSMLAQINSFSAMYGVLVIAFYREKAYSESRYNDKPVSLPDRQEKALLDHVAKCLNVLQTFMTMLQGQTYFALAHAPFLLCRTLRELEVIGGNRQAGFKIPLGKSS